MRNIIAGFGGYKFRMILRNYEHKDRKKVNQFHEQVLKESGAFAPGPWNDDMKNIEEVYTNPGGLFILVEDSNVLIGMGALKFISDKEAEIKRMRVEKSQQRKGIGQYILNHLLSHAQSEGIQRIILDTTELQIPAQEFYIKNGFKEYGQSSWNGLALILYEKKLNTTK
jgi:ribosomal protein S18 acetylase RimI-like enzyme